MPSGYPTSIDSFDDPTPSTVLGSTTESLKHATQHATHNDAIEKIQTELGVNPSGTSDTVAARLTSIESSITTAASTVSGNAGTLRNYTMQTQGTNRWTLTTNATAEGGGTTGSTGSDFEVRAWANNGSERTGTGVLSGGSSGAVLRITRSSGAVALGGALTVGGATSLSGTLTVSGANNVTTLDGFLLVSNTASFDGALNVAAGKTTTLSNRVDSGVVINGTQYKVPYATVPVGVVMPFAGINVPSGWLLCDGTAVSRFTYDALFAVISTTYGAGDNTNTFNVPDLRSRTVVGAGSSAASGLTARSRGTTGGSEGTTLALDQMPEHDHSVSLAHGHTATTSSNDNNSKHGHDATFNLSDATALQSGSMNVRAAPTTSGTRDTLTINNNASDNSRHTHNVTVANFSGSTTALPAGSSTPSPVPTMPPWIALNYIIKY